MAAHYLGADIGASRTRVLITDETGAALGFGETGPGNHESVGYDGMHEALHGAVQLALNQASLTNELITGAGFGVAGYDWPSQWEPNMAVIRSLGIPGPIHMVNDTIIGLVAGAEEGWGIGVVSGTGCNCWGWDRTHIRIGRVTGAGMWMGEAAGGGELVSRALHAAAYQWCGRGPVTLLSQLLAEYCGATSLENMLEGLMDLRYQLDASAAPLVFQAARKGDVVAIEIVAWAGRELAELAKTVIKQIDIREDAFDVVLTGSMFEGGALLIEPMRQSIQNFAPYARLVRLTAAPVIGGVLIGMEQSGLRIHSTLRKKLLTFSGFK